MSEGHRPQSIKGHLVSPARLISRDVYWLVPRFLLSPLVLQHRPAGKQNCLLSFYSLPSSAPPSPSMCVISSILPSNGNSVSQRSSYATHSKMINIFSFWSGGRVKGEKCRLMKYHGITEGAPWPLGGGVGLLPSLHLSICLRLRNGRTLSASLQHPDGIDASLLATIRGDGPQFSTSS